MAGPAPPPPLTATRIWKTTAIAALQSPLAPVQVAISIKSIAESRRHAALQVHLREVKVYAKH
jgi:hypothetical protein